MQEDAADKLDQLLNPIEVSDEPRKIEELPAAYFPVSQ